MKIMYIDPMSYNNLALYDYSLLSNIDCEIYFVGNKLYDIEMINNVPFFPLFCYSQKKSIFKAISYIASLFKIVRLTHKVNPDIIHIQWIRLWFVDYLFLKYLRCKKYKVVYTAHNALPHVQKKNDFKHYKKYYKLVDSIITHSQNTKKELVSCFDVDEAKINVIPHGILDLSTSANEQNVNSIKTEFVEKYNLKNKIVFSSLGLQDFYKGSDLIYDVWLNNFANNKDVFLIIAGSLSDRLREYNTKEFEKLDNTYVNFARIDNDLFLALLQSTDVLLLPYRKISQSGILLSAINEKIPFLVSEVGGLSESLSIGNVGWNIKKATYENLLKQLENILKNKNDLRLKKNNTEWNKLNDYYSWRAIGIKTKQLYAKLLKTYCAK